LQKSSGVEIEIDFKKADEHILREESISFGNLEYFITYEDTVRSTGHPKLYILHIF